VFGIVLAGAAFLGLLGLFLVLIEEPQRRR
jgi:hypothetical protein